MQNNYVKLVGGKYEDGELIPKEIFYGIRNNLQELILMQRFSYLDGFAGSSLLHSLYNKALDQSHDIMYKGIAYKYNFIDYYGNLLPFVKNIILFCLNLEQGEIYHMFTNEELLERFSSDFNIYAHPDRYEKEILFLSWSIFETEEKIKKETEFRNLVSTLNLYIDSNEIGEESFETSEPKYEDALDYLLLHYIRNNDLSRIKN